MDHGVAGYDGGSTQVQLGPGPAVDEVHRISLRAALLTGERPQVVEPGQSEDIGKDWQDPASLAEYGDRDPTEPWTWAGPARAVTGRSWGGCAQVMQWLLTAGRFPTDPDVLAGGVLLLETSEELIPARELGWSVRSLGERGLLAAVDAVLVTRPPTSSFEVRPTPDERAARRAEQRDEAIQTVHRYNPEAIIVVGCALRAHPTAVDRPVRRRRHGRQRNEDTMGGLLLSSDCRCRPRGRLVRRALRHAPGFWKKSPSVGTVGLRVRVGRRPGDVVRLLWTAGVTGLR